MKGLSLGPEIGLKSNSDGITDKCSGPLNGTMETIDKIAEGKKDRDNLFGILD